MYLKSCKILCSQCSHLYLCLPGQNNQAYIPENDSISYYFCIGQVHRFKFVPSNKMLPDASTNAKIMKNPRTEPDGSHLGTEDLGCLFGTK